MIEKTKESVLGNFPASGDNKFSVFIVFNESIIYNCEIILNKLEVSILLGLIIILSIVDEPHNRQKYSQVCELEIIKRTL